MITETLKTKPPANDEIDFVNFLKKIINDRWMIVTFAVVFFLIGGAFQLSKLAFYAPKAIKYPIAFQAASLSNNTYPNGAPFSPSDLIESENIQLALNKMSIEIDFNTVSKALSVSPSNSLVEVTEKKLLDTLSKKKTPSDQVEETKDALSSLKHSSLAYVTLTLDLSELKLTEGKSELLLKNIVDIWAERAIEKGLVNPNVSYPHSSFIYDESAIIIDNYDKLFKYSRDLLSGFNQLSQFGASLTVLGRNQNLNDLIRKINGIIDDDINVMRSYAYSVSSSLIKVNPLLETQIFSQLRVKELNKEEIIKKIKSYDFILDKLNYSEVVASNNRVDNSSPQKLLQRQTFDTNLDQSVFRDLLDLGSQLSSSELKKEIIQKRIIAAERLFALEKEVAMIKGSAYDVKLLKSKQEIIRQLPKIFEKTVKEVNQLQSTFLVLIKNYTKQSLNKTVSLYLPVTDPYIINPLYFSVKKTAIILLASLLVGLFVGVSWVLIRRIVFC